MEKSELEMLRMKIIIGIANTTSVSTNQLKQITEIVDIAFETQTQSL